MVVVLVVMAKKVVVMVMILMWSLDPTRDSASSRATEWCLEE